MNKKQPLVIDSSVIVKWVNTYKEEGVDQANKILEDAKAEKVELFTSEVAKYEVGNALLVKKGLDLTPAYISLGTVYNLPLNFVPETLPLAESTYKIGQELKITYYDASFLSVAEQLGAVLVTDNVKHHGKSTKVKVIPLKDY
ncbi:MAG: type II toxin-antitoxin system VapC family toxin [Candidatus Daviesbacteria bacterium]|nr:type II toxin-antitoxin system VapC family toxin [Candidatus Daviesbacteria bacterium]